MNKSLHSLAFCFWLTCTSNVSLCNGKSVSPAAVYQTFSTNHLSYIKTLVPIYRFRAITFFRCRHFLRKNCLFAQKLKKLFVWAVFLEALIVAPPFLDMCLDIFGAWINNKNLFGTFFKENRAFFEEKKMCF